MNYVYEATEICARKHSKSCVQNHSCTKPLWPDEFSSDRACKLVKAYGIHGANGSLKYRNIVFKAEMGLIQY